MAFNLPTGLYTLPKTGGSYSRPSDWPVITDEANEAQFLFADLGDACLSIVVSNSASPGGTFSIDWGDSSTSTGFSNGSEIRTDHTYTKGAGATCSRGYTTFKIRVYGTAGINFTAIRPRPLSTRLNPFQEVAILEAYYGDSLTEHVFSNLFAAGGSINGGGYFTYLEYFKMPTTTTLTAASYSNMCNQCTSLKIIIMPTSSPGAVVFTQAFNSCFSLLSVTLPSNANPTTMASVFLNCYSLKSVVLPTTMSNCTSMLSVFQNCSSLQNLIIPALPICTDYGAMCSFNSSLTTVTFLGLHTGVASAINFLQTFQNCVRLESVIFPTVVDTSTYNFNQTFSSCMSLRTIKLPAGFIPSSLSSCFLSCKNLQSADITGNGTMSAAFTNMSNVFTDCANLTSITLPYATTSTTGTLAISTIVGVCVGIETLIIPEGLGPSISSFSTNGSSNSYSLKTIVLPTTMNNCVTISINNNIPHALENLTLPTSATSCTNFTITGTQLKTLAIPTLSTALSVMSFANNNLLSTITNMPSTVGSSLSYLQMFQNCFNLKSIVLPANGSSLTTTYQNTFQNCVSLESITLPATQNVSTTANLSGIFNNCASLKTVINFNKIQTTSATPVVLADANNNMLLVPGLTFSCKLAKLDLSGAVTTTQNQLTALRHTNTAAGQWTGTTPQINISFTNITYANLVTFFNDIAAQGNVVTKTINITSCAGAASLTAADRLILTSKGWTITG